MSDIFSRMNNPSVSMQGKNINILKFCEVLNAFKEKLHLWCWRVKRGNVVNVPSLEEVTDEDEFLVPSVREEIMNYLQILSKLFDGYFWVGKLETSEEWIINPYSFILNYMPDDEKLKDNLIELSTKRFLKMQFERKTLEQYWCCAIKMFPRLCEKALSMFIPFATTYLCESGFSTLLSIKTKSRNQLNAQADMRIAISNKVSCFEKLLCNKQKQKSH